jgi:methylenetetrahydrofolate--tRNA-(uracil-5-)-methyltransferase
VDRTRFSACIEEKLSALSSLRIIRQELTEIPDKAIVIIATGPLTSDALTARIAELTGTQHLYFYDALSPIIDAGSINYDKVYFASRYEDGEGDYLNCPMEEEQYLTFREALIGAQEVPLHAFEEIKCFEGCLPVETIARRGTQTLAFGPMKPVGLKNPRNGRQPYAVVQLRREDLNLTMFNLVGFQTKLTWPEQRRVFRMIPGLEKAEFLRYGGVHRNTFIDSPRLLKNTLQLASSDRVLFAGQITGVEGYVESAAMGMIAGLSAACLKRGASMIAPPAATAFGALIRHITEAKPGHFQPMNVNFGLFPPLDKSVRKKYRGQIYADRALDALKKWIGKPVNNQTPTES